MQEVYDCNLYCVSSSGDDRGGLSLKTAVNQVSQVDEASLNVEPTRILLVEDDPNDVELI